MKIQVTDANAAVKVKFGYVAYAALYDAMLENELINEDMAHTIVSLIHSTFSLVLGQKMPGWVLVNPNTGELAGPLKDVNLYQTLADVMNVTMAHVDMITGD